MYLVPEYRKVRLKFSKLGALKFISHLDLDRTMKSVITRSGIKIEYTHGYNPRPYLVFSLPAALGMESYSEFLDIKTLPEYEYEDIMRRLNENLPPDIRILEAYAPESDFKEIETSEYEIVMISPEITADTAGAIADLFSHEVIVEKRTKKSETGTAPFDIAPYVKINSYEYDGKRLRLDITASASNRIYINPEYIIRAAEKYLSLDFTDPQTSVYTITRLKTFFGDGKQFR